MSRAKRHHQVPQFYLRAFADPKGRVRVYDRVSGKTFVQPIANVAVEANFYTVVDATGSPSDEVEEIPAEFEGLVATRLPPLFRSAPVISAADRGILARFVALQFVGTAAMREWLEDTHDLRHRMLIELNVGGDPPEGVERFIAKQYADASEAFKQQVRAVAADPSRPIRLSTEEWLAGSLDLLPALADELLARNWWLADADERAFLTSDDPVVLVADPVAVDLGVGLRTAEQILLPLSPYRVLVMDGPDTGMLASRRVGRDWIRWANRSMANRATRQIFSHPRSKAMDGIQVPPAPRPGRVNGIPVTRGARSWDKLRTDWAPNFLRVRDQIRASHRDRIADHDRED